MLLFLKDGAGEARAYRPYEEGHRDGGGVSPHLVKSSEKIEIQPPRGIRTIPMAGFRGLSG